MDTPPYGLFTVCWCAFSAAVSSEDHRQMEVFAGQDVLLDCRSHQNDVTLLEWIRPDLKMDGYVFFYRERRSYPNYQHPDFCGRVKLADPRMENGNMSVVLTNVQPGTDNGTYLCYVSGGTKGRGRTASSEVKNNITLTVSPAKPGNAQKQTSDGGNKEGGDKDGGDKDGGHKDGSNRRRNGLIVFLSLSVLMAVVFLVIRKEHMFSKEQKKSSVPLNNPAV